METRRAYWEIGTCDMGTYVRCTHCGRKVGVKDFVMANQDWLTCPKCGAQMDLSKLSYARIVQEASNEC